jgi:hypothetical protein
MRIWLLFVVLASLTFASAQSIDPHVRVSNTTDAKSTRIETDYLTLVNTDDDFLQISFVTSHRKGFGLQAITIGAVFVDRTNLYKSDDKREFSLIVDGDRVDYGPMMYLRYTVEGLDGKVKFYGGVPPTPVSSIPSDAQVLAHASAKDLVAGQLLKIVTGFNRSAEPFERIEHAKRITLKVGPNKVALTEDQVNTLRYFIRRGVHG